jgi:UDP-glucuronate 4-epimerase
MRIFLTGAAGFIGSHLAERLTARGHRVVGIDNFDPFYAFGIKEKNLSALRGNDKFTLHRGDILDDTLVARTLAGSDVVCHLAALAGVRPSVADPLRYHRVNVDGTLNLLEACRVAGIKRFVFASSSSVYGARSQIPFREDDACDRPASPYAATKRAAEHYVRTYAHLFGFDATVLRFFTVYGPRQRPEMAIHKFARLMQQGQPVPLYGDGTSARDYTYIDDVIDGSVAAIERSAGGYSVYNLGGERPTTLTQLISELENLLGTRAILSREPMPPGEVPLTCAEITAARRDLHYTPTIRLDEGLRRFIGWLRATP